MAKLGSLGRGLSFWPIRRLVDVLESIGTWPTNRFVALTYHRIDRIRDDGRYPGLISATPEQFADQMTTLAERFNVISINDVLAAVRGDSELPDRAVLLTFDDAVDSFERHALPVLINRHLPAVVFVPTGYVGDVEATFWWDAIYAAVTTTDREGSVDTPVGVLSLADDGQRQQAYRRLRDHCMGLTESAATILGRALCDELGVKPPPSSVMGWDSLRTLESAGIACCPHTRSHAHLDHITAEEVRHEVADSFADLHRELAAVPPVFAYPAGRVTDDVMAIVGDAGIEVAFTTRRGVSTARVSEPLAFRRINVSRRSGFGTVRLQMLPLMDSLRSNG